MSRAWISSTLMSLKKYFSIIISCRAVYGLKITKIKPKDLPSSSALLFFHVRETNICGLCISPMHIRKRCANTKEKSWEVFEWMSNAGNSQCSCPIELNSALCLFNFYKIAPEFDDDQEEWRSAFQKVDQVATATEIQSEKIKDTRHVIA